jgi:hypothetical protein
MPSITGYRTLIAGIIAILWVGWIVVMKMA